MNSLIIMAGLPGTGKTTTAKKLAESLGYVMISQNDVRREHGMKDMPAHQPGVLRDVDKRVCSALEKGGVILDAVHRFGHRRHQLYGIASGLGRDVVVIECIASEEEAKRRISERPASDGLIVDANDPQVYDKVVKGWEGIQDDLYDFSDHVSHILFDTENGKVARLTVNERMRDLVDEVEKHLT